MIKPDSEPQPISLPRLGSAFLLRELRVPSAKPAILVPIPKNLAIWKNAENLSCLFPQSDRLSVSHTPDSPDTLIFSKMLFSTASPRSNGILSKTHRFISRRIIPYHSITEHPRAPLPPHTKSIYPKRTDESVHSQDWFEFLKTLSLKFFCSFLPNSGIEPASETQDPNQGHL